MRFRQCTMHNSLDEQTKRLTQNQKHDFGHLLKFTMERWFCRGELCSPVIDSVILSRAKNLGSLVEVGVDRE